MLVCSALFDLFLSFWCLMLVEFLIIDAYKEACKLIHDNLYKTLIVQSKGNAIREVDHPFYRAFFNYEYIVCAIEYDLIVNHS